MFPLATRCASRPSTGTSPATATRCARQGSWRTCPCTRWPLSSPAPRGVKNIIFASRCKPDIVISDALGNEVRVLDGDDDCLVYDLPIPSRDFQWRGGRKHSRVQFCQVRLEGGDRVIVFRDVEENERCGSDYQNVANVGGFENLKAEDYYKERGMAFVMLVCGRIHTRVIAAVRSLGDSTTSVRDVLLMARRLKLVRRGGSWELANAWRKDLELLEAARLRAGAPHRRRVIRARCCGTGVISLKTCMTVFRPKRILTSTIVGTSASSGGNGLFAHNGVVESIPIAIIVENHKERGIQDRHTPIAVDQFYLLGQDAALLGLG